MVEIFFIHRIRQFKKSTLVELELFTEKLFAKFGLFKHLLYF